MVVQRPALVAEILERYAARALLGRPDGHIFGLWPLGRNDIYRDVARIVIPRLMSVFPHRAKPSQWRRLNNDLIPAAVRHLSPENLQQLVCKKLEAGGMDSAQRLSWLMVGLRLAPHRRSGQIVALVGNSSVRRRKLGIALASQGDHGQGVPKLPALALSRLVTLLAPTTSPDFEAGWVGQREHRRDIVRALLHQLGALPDEAAGEELARLRQLPELRAWKMSLDATRFDHARLLRNARFVLPSVASVADALAGKTPANSLDMVALLKQHLDGLQQRLRGDDTGGLRLFWRRVGAKSAPSPLLENECRDLLLPSLREHLQPLGVSLQKEAAHAEDTRADMRAECIIDGQPVKLPIEIKKEDHRAVWTAWRDQLDALYTTDPAAGGVGLYLVLWFNHRPRVSEHGVAPRSATEMAEMLRSAIPAADRARLQVHVMDLSLGSRATAKAARQGAGRNKKGAGQ